MLTAKRLAVAVVFALGAQSALACGDGKNVGIYEPGATAGTWVLVGSGYYPAADFAEFDVQTDASVHPAGGDPGDGGGGGVVQSIADPPWGVSYAGSPSDGGAAYTQSTPCMPTVTVIATPTGTAGSGRLHVIRPVGSGTLSFAALKRAQVPADRALCSSDQDVKNAEACSAIRRVRPIVRVGMTFLVEFEDATQLYTVTNPQFSLCALPSGPCVPN